MEIQVKKKRGGIAAPILIVVLIVLYNVIVTLVVVRLDISNIIKIVVFAWQLCMTAVLLYVLWERIKEIRSGTEDDIGKY